MSNGTRIGIVAASSVLAMALAWGVFAVYRQSQFAAGIRHCLGQMLIVGTLTQGSEAKIRAEIAGLQRKYGLSAQHAEEVVRGAPP